MAKKAAPKTKAKKKTTKRTVAPAVVKTITLEPKNKKEKKAARKIDLASHRSRLPNTLELVKLSSRILWDNKLLFSGLVFIYIVLTILLVQGITYSTIIDGIGGNSLSASFDIFTRLASTGGLTSDGSSSPYQLFVVVVLSLAVIWTLRQVVAGTAGLRVRDAFYRGMFPLVPVLLVVLAIAVQLIPLVIGSAVFTLAINAGIASNGIETFVYGVVFVVLALLSLYLVCSSIFAFYIATLPDMTPMKALRSARDLVRYRRLLIARKVVGLPLSLFIITAVIMVPVIVVAKPAAQYVFFVLSMLALPAVHAYMYTLYRSLLTTDEAE